jgi:hypothetical protein
MHSHAADSNVQTLGCCAPCLLAEHYAGSIERTVAIKRILHAIRTFPHDRTVVLRSLCALAKLLQHNPVARLVIIIHDGAVRALSDAMQSHLVDKAVQSVGCHVLGFLALANNNQEEMRQQRGIQSVVTAVYNHPEDIDVQETAFVALQNMSAEE